jgi:uncharacterized membrane protein
MVNREREGSGETWLETWISYILISGVLVSLVLEVAGITIFYRASHSMAISQDSSMFVRGQNFFAFLGRLFHETLSGVTALRLMTLGVAILILTPYVRAALSVIYFASTKNIKYLLITLFVLTVLTVSLMMH